MVIDPIAPNAPAAAKRVFRVVLAEDDEEVAGTIRRQIAAAGGEVRAVVARADDIPGAVDREGPDVLVLDIGLEEGDGVEAARRVRASRDVPIVFVTGRSDEATLARVRGSGASGYVVKPFSEGQLRAALALALDQDRNGDARRALHEIADVLARRGLVPGAKPAAPPPPELDQLSAREREIVQLLVGNQRVPTIARRLQISQATVRNHLKSAFRKLGVHSQQELIDRIVPR